MPSFGAQEEPFDLPGPSGRRRSVLGQTAALLLLTAATILAWTGVAWTSGGRRSVVAVFAACVLLLVAVGCTMGVLAYVTKLSARALRALGRWLAGRRSVRALLAAASAAGKAAATGDASLAERSPAGEFVPLDWKRMW